MGALVTGMRVKWAFFGIMLIIGIILFILSLFCLYRYCQHKKYLSENEEDQLVDPMLMATSEDELREFSGNSPDCTRNDRVFNMGKPVGSGHDSGPKGMLDGSSSGPVNKTE